MTRLVSRTRAPLIGGALLLLVVSAAAAPSFAAQSASSPPVVTPAGSIGGVSYSRNRELAPHGMQLFGTSRSKKPAAPGGSGPLVYHGGPVMRTNKTYAIYWLPSGYTMSSNYQSLINRYFTDVAAASGATDNVYAVETQYYDTSGYIAYSSTFGGSTVDTRSFPSNACSISGISKCLTDAQIINEINYVVSNKGWAKNNNTEFFMFTPKGVGSCFYSGSRSSSNPCSFTDFCAYHGDSGSLIYANQPYTVNSTYPNSCDVHQRPNGDDADPTINVASHEHREAINDPLLNAWYDAAGWEGSDKCAWMFGTLSGSSGAQYNQTINGNHYLLQQEYSNDGNACLLGYGSSSPPPSSTTPTISSFSPTSGLAGTASVVITGTNFANVNSVSIGSTAISGYSVDTSTQITAPIPSNALTGSLKVVTADGTATSSSTFKVLPRIDSFTPTSGKKGSTVTVNGNSLTGTTKVTLNGRSCSFTVVSNTQVTFKVPSFFASSGKIAVTTPGGTATSSASFTVTR